MKDLQKTDTFFDKFSGDIVCVTRVVPDPIDSQETKYYGLFCTGPKSTDQDGNGKDLEFGFRRSDVFDHIDVHTDPRKAFNEAIYGKHVAHCTSIRGTTSRSVAIRPYWEDGLITTDRFNIDCSSNALGIRREIHGLTEKQARHLVNMFLYGKAVKIDYPYCRSWINQANRDIEILVDTMTPTRVRIRYDMPYTGEYGAWRKQAQVDQYIFIEGR